MKNNTSVKQNNMMSYILLGAFAVCLMVVTVLCICQPTKINAYANPTVSSVQAQLDSVSHELDVASADYGEALMQKEEAQAKVNEAESTISNANARIADLKGDLSTRAVTSYKNGPGAIFEAFLGVTSLKSFFQTADIVNKLNQKDAEMVAESKELKAKVEESKEALDENLRIAQEKSDEARRIKESAEAKQADLQAQLNKLNEEQRQAAFAQSRVNSGGGGDTGGGTGGGGTGGGGGGGANPPSGANDIVNRAYSQLGKPYVFGAVGPDAYDCSGLVSYCVSGAHRRIGTTYTFMGWPRVSGPHPGCVCTTSSHCGICIGGGSMIHAPQTGDVVKISGIQGGMIYVTQP